MAHCEKFSLNDTKKILKEYSRELDAYKNCVDVSRIKNDYQIYVSSAQNAEQAHQRLKDRIDNLSFRKRKDTVGMCTWVVTCPNEFKNDTAKQREFFSVVYAYTVNRYGADNVLNGYVHNDETSPHMHIPVIPAVHENGADKLNAKSFLTRTELAMYQKELEKECQKHFGIKGLVLNGRTKGNYTLDELKQRTADEKRLTERQHKIIERETDLEEYEINLKKREKNISDREQKCIATEERQKQVAEQQKRTAEEQKQREAQQKIIAEQQKKKDEEQQEKEKALNAKAERLGLIETAHQRETVATNATKAINSKGIEIDRSRFTR